jgi:DNA-binding NtrC family response regulator
MTGDLISLRILVVSSAMRDRDVLRQGASAVSVPVDIIEASHPANGRAILAEGDIDIVFVDSAIASADRAALLAAAKPIPFVFVLAGSSDELARLSADKTVDGVVIKPTQHGEAKSLIERCILVRMPRRILVVDDSGTMRNIVRKILSASRFRLEVADAQEGFEALKQIQSGKFDLVILDYNMPGLNGIETLYEIKREFPRVEVVLMTSTPDEVLAQKARAAGAAAFLKKPFYATDIDAVLHRLFGIRAPEQRLG